MNYEELKTGLKAILEKTQDPAGIENLANLIKGVETLEADDKSKSELLEAQSKRMRDLFLNTPTEGDGKNPDSIDPEPAPEPKTLGEIVDEILSKEKQK